MKKQVNNKIKISGWENSGVVIIISVLGDISTSDGTTIRAKRIFEILKERYSVILITRADKKQKSKDIIIVNPAKTKLWNLKLIPVIIKNKFDVVYCSNDWFGFITYYLLSKIYKYKIIFEAHSILSEEIKEIGYIELKVKFYQFLERFVIKHADYVIALSENTFEFYEKYNQHIELIPVFVNEAVFKINKEIETKKYKRQKRKLIGLIGPFDGMFSKHILEYLHANIDQFDNRIHFFVIGKCDNRIKNNMITYTGYLETTQNYIDVLSNLNAVLVPSKIATLGPLNKIIEPMSCSLPVFTLPKGMVGLYYVENGRDILVFEDDKIIDKVNELIFEDELMKKIGKNARIVVEKYYSKEVNEKKLVDLIEESNATK
jgi:glycosyltransferase involved in cell wall biosynthesis